MAKPTRIDMSRINGAEIRETVANGAHLELHDSTRPDVPPIVLDDFLMAVLRGEVDQPVDSLTRTTQRPPTHQGGGQNMPRAQRGQRSEIAAQNTSPREEKPVTDYTVTFGKVGDSEPVPPVTLPFETKDQFTRAVAQHAIPYLRPALEAIGRPELADCFFRMDKERTVGEFWWIDFQNGAGARFCPARIQAA